MQPDPPAPSASDSTPPSHQPSDERSSKQPRQILPEVFAFPPNRDAFGGTAYLIVEKGGSILIDCPAWHEETQQFLRDRGPLRWLVLTQRDGGRANIARLQAEFDCPVLVQAQEAYLLPECRVETFETERELTPDCRVLWTPGYSPGSSCVYLNRNGGILFSGRHLLPDLHGQLTVLRRPKTFHWWRQLDSTAALRDRFTSETLHYICPGANAGLLRGTGAIAEADAALQQLDLTALRQAQVGL